MYLRNAYQEGNFQHIERSSDADSVVWDLRDLYPGPDSEEFQSDLAQLPERAQTFEQRWRNRLAALSEEELEELLREYEELVEASTRLNSYVHLLWSTDTENPQIGALFQRVRELSTAAERSLVFVPLEWMHAPEPFQRWALDASRLRRWRHWLEHTLQFRPYTLEEAAEQALIVKDTTSRFAWIRLFDELTSGMVYMLDGKPYRQQQLLSLLHHPERELRRRASEAFTRGLQQNSRWLTFIFNTVLADWHATMVQLRKYPTWIAPRNLENEISDAAVNALIQTVVEGYELVERYYVLKRRLLHLERLHEWDRYAPLPADSCSWRWHEAQQIVQQAYRDFSPEFGGIVEQFFTRKWIHAAVRPGKQGGAYSAPTVPSAHPYVFLNFTGTVRDVLTLAHELGHGVHQYLSRQQGILQASAPLTLAEMASTFGEMLVFQRLLRQCDDRQARLSLLLSKVDDIIATVFRQVAMNRFEEAIHSHRAGKGELTTEELSLYWMETQQAMFRSSVELTENYALWWSYIPHFLHVPGYVYAYAFGELLVLALYEQYRHEGPTFLPRYRDLLAAGGSDAPERLLQQFGIDASQPEFWKRGLAVIEDMIAQAEAWSSS
ncbi:MAG: M3 family oligoendopeptidase [Candidatus Kapabacteria bacterium]|nr:M3 family oligoendopeptidase [Candidatus Kapabacteria bacterium]MCS7169122.1 M3 family oligoendopeptidase [Candidatus Kapabacteria bacterium]MDW7997778.1 M3 family oligoendopeptidase [Bacteroidota bacterium]MDW8225336.1 M3 family oligoendopeptidase [Bacteroidota bacterium]